MNNAPDKEILLKVVSMKMPFGKYKRRLICDLPVSYLEWFYSKGFPEGKIGVLLATIYEVKINGLEYLLHPLKNGQRGYNLLLTSGGFAPGPPEE